MTETDLIYGYDTERLPLQSFSATIRDCIQHEIVSDNGRVSYRIVSYHLKHVDDWKGQEKDKLSLRFTLQCLNF